MREDRLTSPDQLLEGMTIALFSSIYGHDLYIVHAPPYRRDGNWFVQLNHIYAFRIREYSLDELGITRRSYARWVETAVALK